MKELNCIGLTCPEPVIKCKEEIEKSSPDKLTVIVDNPAAKENVSRFLKSRGYEIVGIEEEKNYFKILAQSSGKDQKISPSEEDMSQYTTCNIPAKAPEDRQLIFITSATIGHGNDELGSKLMENFIKTLPEMGDSLWRIILVNGGVKLATEEGEVLTTLKNLEKAGVSILVCGTCLDFFNLLEQKKVGETTNMLDVVTSLQMASKVIKI